MNFYLKNFLIKLIPIKKIRKQLKVRLNLENELYKLKSSILECDGSKTVFVIGDSHTDIFNKNTYCEKKQIYKDNVTENLLMANISQFPSFITYHLGACLAYTINKSDTTWQAFEKINFLINNNLIPKNAVLLCVFGEIDCRVHIKKQAEKQNRSIKDVIDDIIAEYGKCLKILASKGYKIIVYGPIASQSDSCKLDPNFPRYGAEIERNQITEIFNQKLKIFCKNNRLSFISIFKYLIDEGMRTKQEYYADGVHLNLSILPFINNVLEKIEEY